MIFLPLTGIQPFSSTHKREKTHDFTIKLTTLCEWNYSVLVISICCKMISFTSKLQLKIDFKRCGPERTHCIWTNRERNEEIYLMFNLRFFENLVQIVNIHRLHRVKWLSFVSIVVAINSTNIKFLIKLVSTEFVQILITKRINWTWLLVLLCFSLKSWMIYYKCECIK